MTPLRLKVGHVLWQRVLKPYLFGKDAEDAHLFTIRALSMMQQQGMLPLLRYFYRSPYYSQPLHMLKGGTTWMNPFGIPAGFDKHAQVIPALDALGLGCIEVGTVTPLVQEGNSRPRVFRYPAHEAIVNRMGFNSCGVEALIRNMRQAYRHHKISAALGISLGKNKETPDDRAVDDYLAGFEAVLPGLPRNAYIQINISSPNTPGLRAIFDRLDEFLGEFIEGAKSVASSLPPLVLKIPPDGLTQHDHGQILQVAVKYGFSGLEATNTTTNQEIKEWYACREQGGLSGSPLRAGATRVVENLAKCREKIDIIGVGGIMSASDAMERLTAGARAAQLYTGLVYKGPMLLHKCLEHNTFRKP